MPRENKEQTVLRLIDECRRYDLHGLDFILSIPLKDLVASYNGIGPDSFPKPICKALDRLSPELRCCALIHDARFSFGDGSLEWFMMANDEFEYNGLLIANTVCRWYNPRRYILRHRVRVYAAACRIFGWDSFVACYSTKARSTNPDLADFCFFPKKN
jgi:hypothetical protein